MTIDWSSRFSPYGRRATASEIRELLKLLDRPGIISFAGGIPDPALFPRAMIAEAHARVLGDPEKARAALQYSVSEGYPPLRDWLAADLARQGIACTRDNIVITNGSQQGLDLLGRLFIGPGDRVLTSRPTYLGALQAFAASDPAYAALPQEEGAWPDPAKLVYVMPDFENPSGRTLSLPARRALLAGAAAAGALVVEDTAYSRLAYDGPPPPSLLALETAASGGIEAGRVILCGTFSRTVVPGLRVGWIVAPRPVIARLVLLKQAADLHTATLTQMVLAEICAGLGEEHVDRLCRIYGERRDAMLAALDRHMPPGTGWTRPAGGMFVWVTLPAGLSAARLLHQAVAEAGVAFVPGDAFFPDRNVRNTLRLSFSLSDPAQIAEGIRRLGDLIAAAVPEEAALQTG